MSRVSYHPIFTDNFKFNSYTINFLMPLSEENATCSALLSQVLKRGCQKYGEMDRIVSRLEELYGASITVSSDKIGNNLSFTVQGYCMDDGFAVENENILESVLDLIADILLNPVLENDAFRSDYFDQEKINQSDMIRGIINDKRVFSMMRCKEIMFADSVYRFSSNGTIECLDRITSHSLVDFYRNMLKSAKVIITYIGRQVPLEQLSQKYFADIMEGEYAELLPVDDYTVPTEIRSFSEAFEVAQGKLCMGFRLTKPVDYFAARLFNVIFGGSPTSKLFMNVRERLSLCYYCSSMIDPFVHSMFISSGIEFDKFFVAKEEIFNQLNDMKNGNISEEEFENGKLYLLDYIKGMKDSHSLLLSNAIQNHLLGFDYDVEEQLERVSSLQMEEIINVAKCIVPDTVYFLKGEE